MSHAVRNWLSGKDEPDDLSVFVESYVHRLKADFVQLLAGSRGEGEYNQCYTFPGRRNFSYEFSLQHKGFAEHLVSGTEVSVYDKDEIENRLPETNFIRQLSYGQLVFLPIADSKHSLGLLCIYFANKSDVDPDLLSSIRRELAILLMGHVGNHYRLGEIVIGKVSGQLTFLRCRKELSEFLDNGLKNTLGYKQSTIFLFDPESNNIRNVLSEFHVGDPSYVFYENVRLGKTPMDEYLLSRSAGAVTRDVLDFEGFHENPDIFPYLVREEEQLTNGVVFNLYGGDELIGKWIILFGKEGWNCAPGRAVLQLIAAQLTLTVARIIAAEKLQKIEEESEVLSSLNADFSATRDKQYLLSTIQPKLRKLFNFSHFHIGLISEDECTTSAYLKDFNARTQNHPRYAQFVSAKYSLVDGIFNKVLLSSDPVVFDLEELRQKGMMTEYTNLWYECEIRKVTICTLKVRARTIGFWSICHLEGQDMSTRQRELMKSISAQFSIAVDNLRAADLILAKEQEMEKLLKLSFHLTRTRTKKELLAAVREHMSGLINFRELVIKIVTPRMQFYTFLAVSVTDPLLEQQLQSDDGQEFNCAALHIDDALVADVARRLALPDAPPQLRAEFQRGVREKVLLCLPIEDGYRVSLAIHFDQVNTCSEHLLRLIKSVSYQLSFIVSNILVGERIIQRVAERDLLLSLSTRIATARNSADLLGVIDEHIKPILGFSHMVIGSIDAEGNRVEPLFSSGESPCRSHPLFAAVDGRALPVSDGILDLASASPEPMVFDLDSMRGSRKFPDYLQMNYASGIKQLITVRLGMGRRASGLWLLFTERKQYPESGDLHLINGIAAQITGALFNIRSNTTIEQRVDQKDRLIGFNDRIASVREKGPLARAFGEQLKQMFDVPGYVFFQFDETGTSCFPALYWMDDSFAANTELLLAGGSFPTRSALFDSILAGSGLQTMEVKEAGSEDSFQKVLRIAQANGLETFSGQALRVGEKVLGILIVLHRQKKWTDYQANLWRGVSGQMATAIANLLANEQVGLQLEEIKKYKARLEEEKIYLQEELETTHQPMGIIGESPEIKKVFHLVNQVAASDSTVLILGETGTGKELIARAIHNNSPRKGKLMVKVNCAALPANLIESELFGHERGSFTGATERRIGKFELANNGTLFLDEIGEMPLELQTKLLRALQEKEIERIGGKAPIKVDVRIIAATNRNLETEMMERRFRSDLFYRLNIFPISLPPLRQRKEDIRMLALHFIERFAKKAGKKIRTLSSRVLTELQQYSWPGNVRELEHTIERSILLSSGDTLQQVDLPSSRKTPAMEMEGGPFVPYTIDENERVHILKVLKFCNGKINGKGGAAAILGVPPSTLNSKMKRLNIKKLHMGEGMPAD